MSVMWENPLGTFSAEVLAVRGAVQVEFLGHIHSADVVGGQAKCSAFTTGNRAEAVQSLPRSDDRYTRSLATYIQSGLKALMAQGVNHAPAAFWSVPALPAIC